MGFLRGALERTDTFIGSAFHGIFQFENYTYTLQSKGLKEQFDILGNTFPGGELDERTRLSDLSLKIKEYIPRSVSLTQNEDWDQKETASQDLYSNKVCQPAPSKLTN